MSAHEFWHRIRTALAMLGGQPPHRVQAGRPRLAPPAPEPDAPALGKDGFAEEALPWLDAVYGFALRLTRGDEDEANDLVQETFVSAYRSWHTFTRGSNARLWLFTICRHSFLKSRDRAAVKKEVSASELDADPYEMGAHAALGETPMDPEEEFFREALDDRVVQAIDELPDDFRDVLVLSDLGDLKYNEIMQVLGLPLGTVKSRLFRARQLLQVRLLGFAREEGYVENVATETLEDE